MNTKQTGRGARIWGRMASKDDLRAARVAVTLGNAGLVAKLEGGNGRGIVWVAGGSIQNATVGVRRWLQLETARNGKGGSL